MTDSLTIFTGASEFLKRRFSMYLISTTGSVLLAALVPGLLSMSVLAPFGLNVTQLTLGSLHATITVGAFASAWLTAIGLSAAKWPAAWRASRGSGQSFGRLAAPLSDGEILPWPRLKGWPRARPVC